MALRMNARSWYYSSGSLHGLMASRPLTLPYHMQQHVSHDMRPALTRENAWMITNRDCSTGCEWRDDGAGLPGVVLLTRRFTGCDRWFWPTGSGAVRFPAT